MSVRNTSRCHNIIRVKISGTELRYLSLPPKEARLAFRLVYRAQNDPQWANDILGFGKTTLLQEGCAVSSIAMLLSGYGYSETPGSLNKKLKDNQGFSNSSVVWQKIPQLYPQIKLVNVVRCETTNAPLGEINGYLDKGQPVVVGVDTSPVEGFQSHYVLLYARQGNDYLMLDPWPYRTEQTLMARYGKGRPLQQVIQRVVYYTGPGAGGPIAPSAGSVGAASGSSISSAPAASPPRKSKMLVQVEQDGSPIYVNPGRGRVISTEKMGARLIVIENEKKAARKVGVAGNWLNVKASNGQSGFIDAGSVTLV